MRRRRKDNQFKPTPPDTMTIRRRLLLSTTFPSFTLAAEVGRGVSLVHVGEESTSPSTIVPFTRLRMPLLQAEVERGNV